MRGDRQTRRLLLMGFGGLLLLLLFSGLNALSVLRNIQAQNERIRDDYLNRNQILGQLRSDIFLSGTYVRDLLLEPEPNRADTHRLELQETHERIERSVAEYERVIRADEQPAFQQFKTELEAYFSSLRPALEWDAGQRRSFGYAFMKNSLLPRRMVVVHLADEVSRVNQQQMETGNKQVSSLFARFRMLSTLFLVLSLIGGVLLATGSIRRILRLERISGKRFEEAERSREALKDLSARLIEVQESERKSLSRELHDEVGQSLSALLLGIANVAAIVPPESAARMQLHDLRRLAERTVATVRDMSLLLRPSMLDDLGLIPAVQWQAREVSRNNNIYVQVLAESVLENVPDDYKTCIYRIVQEALRNVVRHAKAKTVQINLSIRAEVVSLTIQDDGGGFQAETDKGLGLLGMEERVSHLGGGFRIESQPGKGACVRVELPLAKEALVVQE